MKSILKRPDVIRQINPHCCGVASVVFEAMKSMPDLTQGEVLKRFELEFPNWKDKPGSLRPMELLRLVDLLGLRVDDFVATKCLREAARMIAERGVFAGLYWTRFWADSGGHWKPTDHVMAIIGVDGGVLPAVDLMDPDPGRRITLSDADHNRADGTLLLCLNSHEIGS